MVLLTLLRLPGRLLRSVLEAVLAVAGGAPSAVLLATLCVWPLSAGLAASGLMASAEPFTPPPSSSLSETLSLLLRRVRAGLPHLPSAPRAVRDTVDAFMDLAALSSPSNAMARAMPFLPSSNDDGVTSADILESYGYPAETHWVWTEDGYRLRLDRVGPRRGRDRGQPLLLAHGMQTASPCFLLRGKDKSLATMLYDAGYDVWMLNYRGTHYSMEHRNLSTHDEEFWKFSFHEHGVYDNPAAIDYVLQETGFPSLMYVSHSMGSTSFMIMASTRPEYNDKILSAHLMAPAGPLHHHRSPLVGVLYGLNNVTQPLVDRLHLNQTMRLMYRFIRRFAALFSSMPGTGPLLYALTSTIVGYNPQADYYELPYFWKTIPSGGSWREIFHYEQNAKPHVQGFRQYDHGAKKNVELYGSAVPPLYELSNIRAPVHLYLAHNDILCADTDMDYLREQLRSLVSVYYAPESHFNHMDFFAGRTADRQIYMPMLKQMRRYEAGTSSPGTSSAGADNSLGLE